MSVATKPTKPSAPQQRPLRRLWKAPRSKVWWMSLLITVLFYLGVLALYLQTVRRPGFNDAPGLGGLSRFGIIALGMVMLASTYTLRRRFLRFLPGKAQDWLWVHNWLGIVAVLIAMFHSNFDHLLRDYCFSSQCLLNEHFGPFALYALILLVGCGIFGRLFDQRLTRIIAQEASSNGVGIVQALEARVLELRYAVERLYAGKSEVFKQYCVQALSRQQGSSLAAPITGGAEMNYLLSLLPPGEHANFQQASNILAERDRLLQSMRRQQRAQSLMRRWRTIHIILACTALVIICLHVGIAVFSGVLSRLRLR
jgi:hypothetical protein